MDETADDNQILLEPASELWRRPVVDCTVVYLAHDYLFFDMGLLEAIGAAQNRLF